MDRTGRRPGADGVGLGPLTPQADAAKPVQTYAHSGGLGSSTSARRPAPTPTELVKTTLVAAADATDDELDRYYTQRWERDLVADLRRRYVLRLRSAEVRNRDGLKTPDALRMDARRTVELKQCGSQRAICSQLRWAMSPTAAVEGLRKSLHDYGAHYCEILLILGSGQAVRWTRGT